MTRVGRIVGAALVWTVLGAACVVALAICLPLLVVAGVCRGVYRIGRALIGRGEMSGTPDDLNDVLRAEIDGDGEAYAVDLLRCGCPKTTPITASCPHCGWETCLGHAAATHLCERSPDPVVEAFDTNPRNPLSLDQRLDVLGAALVEEIYEYLESAQ